MSLREHLETLILGERELREKNERMVAEQLDRQAVEYLRRLDGLNHEGERIRANQATSVSREVYERDLAADREWKAAMSTRMDEARGASQRQAVLFGAFVLLLGVALRWLS